MPSMRLRSLSGLGLASLFAAGVVASACGSSSDKKNVPRYTGAGEGGLAGDASAGAGATTPQGGDTAGEGGATPQPQGGAAGADTTVAGGAGGAGVAGGAAPTTPFHGLYIGPKGADTADGTADAPFKTLAHAASLAQPGDTIVFLDGVYLLGAVVATTIPDGVDLMAENAGAVTLTGSGDLLKLAGSTRIRGLKLNAFGHVATYPAGTAAKGRLTIEDSTFVGCATACFDLPGSVEASVTSAADFIVGDGGNTFAQLSDSAQLKVNGGILQGYGAAGVIRATDDTTVALSELQVLGGSGWALVADKNTVASLDGVTIATQSQGLIQQKGQSAVTVKNSDLSMQAATQFVYECFDIEMDGVGSLTVEDSKLHDCNTGFKGQVPATLTITRTDVYDMAFGGIDLNGVSTSIGGTVRITDSQFRLNKSIAARIQAGGTLDLKVRGTLFSGATTNVTWQTVYLDGSGASLIDLGTGAEPGGNSFLSASASYTGLWIGMGLKASTILASGNTWTPLAQAADAQGHYSAAATPGAKLDVTSTVAGQNYSKTYGGTIRLAETPL